MNKKLLILSLVLVMSAGIVLANYDSRPTMPGPYPPMQGNGPSPYYNQQNGNYNNAPPPQMNGNQNQYGQFSDRRPPNRQMNGENRYGSQNWQSPRPPQMNGGQPPQFNGNNPNYRPPRPLQ